MKHATKITLAVIGAAGLAATVAGASGWGEGHGRSGEGRRGAMLFERFDADGDGAVKLEEAQGVQTERLKRFDADGDGALTLEEYEALWLDAHRARMVDSFQRFDDDGDGRVTGLEIVAPAKRLARLDVDGDGDVDREDLRALRQGREDGHHERGRRERDDD